MEHEAYYHSEVSFLNRYYGTEGAVEILSGNYTLVVKI